MKYFQKMIFNFVLLLSLSAVSAPAKAYYAEFSTILNKFVIEKNLPNGGYETAFDYAAALKDPSVRPAIQSQLAWLDQFDTSTLTTKEQANAFWINAYNFLMIAKIFKDGATGSRLKINSVKDMGSLFSPYKAFKDKDFKVGGKLLSLDDIEKGILLGDDYKKKGWKDARIHFAVNCASVGCPSLIPSLYMSETLNEQLDSNTKKAFKTPRHLSLEGNSLRLTQLFEWYESDFTDEAGTVKNFILKFVDDASMSSSINSAKQGAFINYDWNLNKPENFK